MHAQTQSNTRIVPHCLIALSPRARMQSHQAPVWNSLTAASKRAVGASSEAALGARDRVLILGMVMSLDLRGFVCHTQSLVKFRGILQLQNPCSSSRGHKLLKCTLCKEVRTLGILKWGFSQQAPMKYYLRNQNSEY